MKTSLLMTIVMAIFGAQVAVAGVCVKTETRFPCKTGNAEEDKKIETTCYEKCKGQATCDKENNKVGSEESCLKWAQNECSVFRPKVTDYKKVTVKFNGKELNAGKDVCQPEKPEYKWHQCK